MKKGTLTLSPLHKEIFRANFSGLSVLKIAELFNVSPKTVYNVLARAQGLIDNGQFDEYAQILPDETWSLAKKDKTTGKLVKALDDGTQMSHAEWKHIKRNEINTDSVGFERDIHHSIFAKKVADKANLKVREHLMTLRRADGATFKEIADEVGVSRPRTQQIVETTLRKLREGMSGDVNVFLKTNPKAVDLRKEECKLKNRQSEINKLFYHNPATESELAHIQYKLCEISTALRNAKDKALRTLLEA